MVVFRSSPIPLAVGDADECALRLGVPQSDPEDAELERAVVGRVLEQVANVAEYLYLTEGDVRG